MFFPRFFVLSSLIMGFAIFTSSPPSWAMEEGDTVLDSPLMKLPSEVHILIMSHLSLKELLILPLVSHYWEEVSKDNTIWKKIATENKVDFLADEKENISAKTRVKEYFNSPVAIRIKNDSQIECSCLMHLDITYGSSFKSLRIQQNNIKEVGFDYPWEDVGIINLKLVERLAPQKEFVFRIYALLNPALRTIMKEESGEILRQHSPELYHSPEKKKQVLLNASAFFITLKEIEITELSEEENAAKDKPQCLSVSKSDFLELEIPYDENTIPKQRTYKLIARSNTEHHIWELQEED